MEKRSPYEDEGVEICLTGKKLTEETEIEAAEIALKNAIPLAINDYKIDMAKVMVRRFFEF
ncbi:MAG: hypothetical protein HFG72_13440 [Hungatella sp.]|jgi:CO/xanthine dehydrogenase FAD-binding subunit|nr:hypothetical protein [Hungatella sp.]